MLCRPASMAPIATLQAGANSWVQDGLLPLRIDGVAPASWRLREALSAWVDRQAASAPSRTLAPSARHRHSSSRHGIAD